MTKVLNVITGGLGREGITMTQLELIKNMDTSRLQIDIAAVHNDEADVIKEFEAIGCKVYRLPDRKRKILSYIMKFHKLIIIEKYDIIHVHGSSSLMVIELLLAKFAGIKVRIAHSRNTQTEHSIIDSALRGVFNRCYTDALACGVEAGEWLFKKKDYIVFHNGKDLNKYLFSETIRKRMRAKLGINEETAIGFVGNLNYQKNLPFLLEIIKKNNEVNPNCLYFIVGDGPQKEDILKKIMDYKLTDKVQLTGRITNISDMLQAMDIMLLPSHFEGLPNVVLEWQASGLPSIVSDKVTEECKVCDLVSFLPIGDSYDLWVNKIINISNKYNREYISNNACQKLKENGFDLHENVRYLRDFYLKSAGDLE